MSYDQWIAIGIANNHINKKFISQFANVLEIKLKEHYEDKIKMINPVAAFTADVERILPDLRPELRTIEAVDPIISPLPPMPPVSPMAYSSFSPPLSPMAKPYSVPVLNTNRKPFESMTYYEKIMYRKCPPDSDHGVCINWLKGECYVKCGLRHTIFLGFKSRLCRKWTEGKCPYEDIKCSFAHGNDDIFNRDTMKTKYSNKPIVFEKYENQKDYENIENMIWQHFQESN
jgi:hypothetical protein